MSSVRIVILLACLTVAAYASSVSAIGEVRAVTTPSPECRRRCQSCPKTPTCKPGTSLVTDECGCCKTCARQLGESCDDQNKCDLHKNLYCSYRDIDEAGGICVAKPGRSCFYNSKTYLNGETFNMGCSAVCTCIDGHIGCAPMCPITTTPPKNCRHPRLVLKPNKCCSEWVCSARPLQNVRDPRPLTSGRRPHASAARTPESRRVTMREDRCLVQTTEWSACSSTCGWGISERVTNDNKNCKLRTEKRLCQLRPCTEVDTTVPKRGKKCSRTVKSPRRVRFSFSGCHSRVYTPKYCGKCTDGRCCTPKRTVTKAVKFTCDNGSSFKKRMMMIRSCECKQRCPESNNIFRVFRQMGGDTWSE